MPRREERRSVAPQPKGSHPQLTGKGVRKPEKPAGAKPILESGPKGWGALRSAGPTRGGHCLGLPRMPDYPPSGDFGLPCPSSSSFLFCCLFSSLCGLPDFGAAARASASRLLAMTPSPTQSSIPRTPRLASDEKVPAAASSDAAVSYPDIRGVRFTSECHQARAASDQMD